jgi:peptidylglycine monooxygenase
MAASHELVVALGNRRYRVERPFGAWPDNAGFVSDVAVDGRGHVYVGLRHDCLTQANDPRVIELDPSGNYVSGWGGDLIADLHMLTVVGERVMVVDRDMHEILICDRNGARIGGLGLRGTPLAPFNHPSDVTIAPSGMIFVSDGYAASLVHRFAADGAPLGSFGGFGREPGRFLEPHALWARQDGRIAVVDRVADRVQILAADGTFHSMIEGFYRPVAIWGDAADNLFVTDSVPSLHMLDPDGGRIGRCRPVLNGAHGIFGTPDGDLLLAESNPSRVSRLRHLA